MELQRILVVLGTDDAAWQPEHPLIQRAADLGHRFEAALILLHVAYEHTLGFGVFASRDEIDAGRLKYLARYRERQEQLCDELTKATGLDVSTETIWNHDRSGTILETAAVKDSDLILKQSADNTYVLGLFPTTDWDLVREAGKPVWFVPSQVERGPADGIVAAVDQMFYEEDVDEEFQLDHDCFDTAKQLSDRFGCPLFAVHAYLVPNVLGGYESMLPITAAGGALPSSPTLRSTRSARADISRRHRDVVLDFIDEHGIPLDDVIVREGHVDQVLTATARAMKAGLIVMGSSNKSWWDRLLGRVNAEPTLANAPCDVLFIRPT